MEKEAEILIDIDKYFFPPITIKLDPRDVVSTKERILADAVDGTSGCIYGSSDGRKTEKVSEDDFMTMEEAKEWKKHNEGFFNKVKFLNTVINFLIK